MKVGALCAGYGGLELALAQVWAGVEVSWVSEIDRHAAEVLDVRFGAPNLGDLTTITAPPPVDIVTAGFPCQPVSTSGRRRGVTDERWIIDDICRVASAAGASMLILENVRGLLTANNGEALARVCAAMAAAGFSRWEWTTLRASDVGACHRRERWFCVAHTESYEQREPTVQPVRPEPRRCVERFGPYQQTVEMWAGVVGRAAPEPLNEGKLSPRFVEWMMGLEDGWVTDVVGTKTHAFRLLGNGVVPQQAVAAIVELTSGRRT